MPCPDPLHVQAYGDGELDSASALDIEFHLKSCAQCRERLEQDRDTRTLLKTHASYYRAQNDFRRRVTDQFSGKTSLSVPTWFKSPWASAGAGAAVTALAATMVFTLIVPPASSALITDIANEHLRSLASAHLIDIASDDRHTVKPWLSQHADLSPPVGDFRGNGFDLVGGRIDFVEGSRAAVTVYRHGAHVVNVFSWANQTMPIPDHSTLNGYHMIFWRQGNLVFCAISDIPFDDIVKLSDLLQGKISPTGRE